MRKSKFTEEQITRILSEQQNGQTVADVSRKHGISGATFFKWKAKYASKKSHEPDRAHALEEENGKLRNLLVEAMLELATLKGASSKISSSARAAVKH